MQNKIGDITKSDFLKSRFLNIKNIENKIIISKNKYYLKFFEKSWTEKHLDRNESNFD